MPAFPIQPTTGDPVFRGLSSSIDSVRRFSRTASDSAVKLNSQERIVSPGEDSLSFSASRQLRSQMGGLRAVQESGQINVTTLNLAIEGLESIRGQLDGIKRLVVQSQTATAEERNTIQSEIDLALKQIDATASSTKVGSRSLLDGSSTMRGFSDITANGTKTDFTLLANGASLAAASGVQGVKVNKIGSGLPTSALTDGRQILTLTASIQTVAVKANLAFAAGGAATDFSDFRITGKLGSATVRISGDGVDFTNAAVANAALGFNALAGETGVVLASVVGGGVVATTVGSGDDEFVKIEYLGGTNGGATFGGVGGGSAVGEAQTSFGTAAIASINGTTVRLGGEFGTTARLLDNGFDIEIDFSTVGIAATGTGAANTIDIELNNGIGGLLGASGSSVDALRYGIGNFTTEALGRGNGQNSVVGTSGSVSDTVNVGNKTLGNDSVASLGTGGALTLDTARLSDAINTIDRAVSQVVKEQARLGSIQSNFMDAVGRAEVTQGNIAAADADIVGVDAAAEITNLVQAQVGVSTATALSSQITSMQQNILSLLRG